IASIDSSLAESIKAQVLTTSTSASSARDVISIPRCKTLPSMTSASTRFLAQPRLIMPTFGFRETSAFMLIFIFYPERPTSNAHRFTAKLSALSAECWALSVRCFLNPSQLSIDRYVLVVFLQRLSVLGDLNGFRIEHPN